MFSCRDVFIFHVLVIAPAQPDANHSVRISNILHAIRKFKEIKMGTMMLGANTIGNSKMNSKPGSFIQ